MLFCSFNVSAIVVYVACKTRNRGRINNGGTTDEIFVKLVEVVVLEGGLGTTEIKFPFP
jgi:hypothetical protein